MLENGLGEFNKDMFILLSGRTPHSSQNTVLKKHTENLSNLGDFSYPNKVEAWICDLNNQESSEPSVDISELRQSLKRTSEKLISRSKEWLLPLAKVKEIKDRIHVFLEHSIAITVGIREGLKNKELLPQIIHNGTPLVEWDPALKDAKDLTTLRVKCVAKAAENIYVTHPKCTDRSLQVFVTSKHQNFRDCTRNILCSAVLNARTCVRESKTSADEFIKIRQQEMSLIAQHKYGVRVSTDPKWREYIEHLGESAVTFELLQVRPSSAVKVNLECSSAGSSKGAAFILYNCARLETMLRTFEENVNSGVYPTLPDYNDVDFTLLTQEDEWNLVFNYILGFPHMLHSCVELSDTVCEFRPHYICSFLCSMVRVFSQYYRRVRVLTEARAHLLPVMFARIYLLKALMGILKNCLNILNIKSVSQMYIRQFDLWPFPIIPAAAAAITLRCHEFTFK